METFFEALYISIDKSRIKDLQIKGNTCEFEVDSLSGTDISRLSSHFHILKIGPCMSWLKITVSTS